MRISSRLRGVITTLLLAAPLAACGDNLLRDDAPELAEYDTPENDGLGGVEGGEPCTFTQGYWKNHPEAWPVATLTLGSVTYTQAELLAILGEPVAGNGLIALAHQLIAAKLNVELGAPLPTAIAAADLLIGSLIVPPIGSGTLPTSITSPLNDALDAFNNSGLSGGECEAAPVCGNGVVEGLEECDDGNTAGGDGCSATCTVEVSVPMCGDGVTEGLEECDDGNTVDGDGCSATCTLELVEEPCCGNGIIEAGETCDDGNTVDGDGCSATCIIEVVPC